MALKIDLDRGVECRRAPGQGIEVFMYVDDPGVYLNHHGDAVTEEVAALTGFPVERNRLLRERKSAVGDALAAIEAKFGAPENTVTAERNGYTLVHAIGGLYNIFSPDGDRLNARPLGTGEAQAVFDQLTPPDAFVLPIGRNG